MIKLSKTSLKALTSIAFGILASAPAIAWAEPSELMPRQLHPTRFDQGQESFLAHAASPAKGGTSNGITYHKGPIMLGTTNVYYIWYGNWSGNTATSILPFFASNIGGSAYFNINTTYSDGSGNSAANSVNFAGQITDNYSRGKSLSDTDIQNIVTSSIQGGSLPFDASGVYFVLTSADVTASSGFCTKYCGWHTYAQTNQGVVKYSFVGNPDRCPSSCAAQTVSPNNNAGADGMASIIAHELEETVTDPQLNAWYDQRGYENADKCAWTFGSTSLASNGSKYNMVLNGMQFLIQRNWVNASGGYCSVSY